MANLQLFICGLLLALSSVHSLDNGVARTPPMGFLSWEKFRCNINCAGDPQNCISEKLYKDMADRLVSDGYKDVGYEFVNIDDCWAAMDRDPDTQKLVADPDRFPSGIKSLADYVHSKGLKLGIYGDFGTKTCGGYPGSLNYLELDAQTFAEWGVDMVKLDGCNVDISLMENGYPEFGKYLNQTGRPIVYSCSWPAYVIPEGGWPNFDIITKSCNLWRNGDDIEDSWKSIAGILDYFIKYQDKFAPLAGPGQWNDPDMLIIGDSLTAPQSRSQMAIWSIMAAPLLISSDIRMIGSAFKKVLQNTDVIAIDQDVLGIQGKRIMAEGDAEVWVRDVTPVVGNQYSKAVAFFHHGKGGDTLQIKKKLSDIGLTNANGYDVKELYKGESIGTLKPDDILDGGWLSPGQVFFVKATAL